MNNFEIFLFKIFDFLRKMRFSRALKGGSNWANLPPEKFPSPQFWNKCIPGTPFARVQAEVRLEQFFI